MLIRRVFLSVLFLALPASVCHAGQGGEIAAPVVYCHLDDFVILAFGKSVIPLDNLTPGEDYTLRITRRLVGDNYSCDLRVIEDGLGDGAVWWNRKSTLDYHFPGREDGDAVIDFEVYQMPLQGDVVAIVQLLDRQGKELDFVYLHILAD